MRLGRDDAPDGAKSVLSGLPRPLAAVMPVTLRSCSVPGQEGWPKPSAQFDPGWSTKAHANVAASAENAIWRLHRARRVEARHRRHARDVLKAPRKSAR